MNAVPDETMIQQALNLGDSVRNRHPRQMCFQEHGDAKKAAMGLVPKMSDIEKACPPIDQYSLSYHVWSVQMHFIRSCAFEPRSTPLRSIVEAVDDQCRCMAEALVDDLQLVVARDKAPEVTKQVAEKLHELFEDGEFSIAD